MNDAPYEAFAQGDLRVLLMCLVHLTGDRRWLEAPYLPGRDARIVADEMAGFPQHIADEIRSAAAAHAFDAPVIGEPDDELQSGADEDHVAQSSGAETNEQRRHTVVK